MGPFRALSALEPDWAIFRRVDFTTRVTYQPEFSTRATPDSPPPENNAAVTADSPLRLGAVGGMTFIRGPAKFSWTTRYFGSYQVSRNSTILLNQGGRKVGHQTYRMIWRFRMSCRCIGTSWMGLICRRRCRTSLIKSRRLMQGVLATSARLGMRGGGVFAVIHGPILISGPRQAARTEQWRSAAGNQAAAPVRLFRPERLLQRRRRQQTLANHFQLGERGSPDALIHGRLDAAKSRREEARDQNRATRPHRPLGLAHSDVAQTPSDIRTFVCPCSSAPNAPPHPKRC